jgi:hypothetical protein
VQRQPDLRSPSHRSARTTFLGSASTVRTYGRITTL